MLCPNCAPENVADAKFCGNCRTPLNVIGIGGIATLGIGLVPLAWGIPMTVRSWGVYKGKKPNTVALGVCTLLFLNMVSGILLLVAQKDE